MIDAASRNYMWEYNLFNLIELSFQSEHVTADSAGTIDFELSKSQQSINSIH